MKINIDTHVNSYKFLTMRKFYTVIRYLCFFCYLYPTYSL